MTLMVNCDLCVVLTTFSLYQYMTTINGRHAYTLLHGVNCPSKETIQPS